MRRRRIARTDGVRQGAAGRITSPSQALLLEPVGGFTRDAGKARSSEGPTRSKDGEAVERAGPASKPARPNGSTGIAFGEGGAVSLSVGV
jgi:hypothetical protein